MSAPGVKRIVEPGETEFSHGKGLRASATQRGQHSDPIDPKGPWELSVYDQGKAIQRTNPADPTSVADPTMAAASGTNANYNGIEWVRE